MRQTITRFLRSLELRWSDLFLLVFVVSGLFVCVESYSLASTVNPSATLPLWLIIGLVVLSNATLIVYCFFELKKESVKYVAIVLGVFLVVLVAQMVTLCLFPNTSCIVFDSYSGQKVQVITQITDRVKVVYFFGFVYQVAIFYIGVYLFPKRVKNVHFVINLIYVFYVVFLFLLLFSLFAETNNYGNLSKSIFADGNLNHIEDLGIKSIMSHRNVYAFILETIIFLSLINKHLSKYRWNYVVTVMAYLELAFTVCKTGIIIATASLLIYYLIKLILLFKSKQYVSFVVFLTILISAIIVVLSITISKSLLSVIFDSLVNANSMVLRKIIWGNAVTIINEYNWFFGAGFGTYNSVLLNANINVNADYLLIQEHTPLTHNSYLSIIGVGGIVLFLVVGSMGLFLFGLFLCFCFLLSILSFFVHSFVEDNYYYIIIFIMFLSIINFAFRNDNTIFEK